MSDAQEQRPTTPFPVEGNAPPPVDPLAGDWSDGLRGPIRALGIPEPKRLLLEGLPQPLPPPRPAIPEPVTAPVAEVEAPDAWGASEDPLQSSPPSVIITFSEPPSAPPPQADVTPPSPAPAFLPDITPPSPAPAFQSDITPATAAPAFQPEVASAPVAPAFQSDVTPTTPVPAFEAPPPPSQPAGSVVDLRAGDAADWSAPPPAADAPTPWSMPVPSPAQPPAPDAWKDAPVAPPAPTASWAQVTAVAAVPPPLTPAPAWDMPPPAPPAGPVAAADDAWSSPPPPASNAVEEWKAEAPAADWEQIKTPAPPVLAEPAAADWGTLSSGPDWSTPPPAEAAAAEESWGAPPPAPSTPDWAPPAPAATSSEWDAPAPAAAETDWSSPPPPVAAAETEWSPAAPPPPSAPSWRAPPAGASTFEQMDSEPEEYAASPEAAKNLFGSVPAGSSLAGDDEPRGDGFGPPEELSSPEDFLKPVEDDDPNLLVPVEEEPRPPPPKAPPAQPLGAMKPLGIGALEVHGEHRVAVHTRGGRTRRGSVKDIDLSKSQFALVPQGGGAAEPIYHAEVKAVFFMLPPGEKPKPPDGGKVRVTFADGRSIEGYRDGADAKHGFFLIPFDAARTNTRRIYIAREACSEIKDG